MSPEHDPAEVARLQAAFAQFAEKDVFLDDPLYAAITTAVAQRADWAAMLAAAPATQRLPLLWLAALQDRVLALVDAGDAPPLGEYFSRAGGARAPDDALVAHLGDFIARERATLLHTIATRSTQTNEIGRSAVLWPVLQALVERTGRRRIALLDVGCSAGLNLGVDRWRYRYVDDATGALVAATPASRDPGAPEITCRVLAGARDAFARVVARSPEPEIACRAGVDLKPIDVADAAEVRWLRACVWPHDVERRARFDAAVAIARTQRWPVAATADAAAAIVAWRAGLPHDVLPVVFNSWVLSYFDAPLLRRHVDALLELVARRDVAWISAENPRLSRTWWPDKPSTDDDARANATSWTVALPDGRGGVAWQLGATSHAHGRWMHWNG